MPATAISYDAITDVELAALAALRDVQAVRTITTRNNQRLFRTAWSVLRNNDDAEDAVQQGYLRAFGSIQQYSGASSLSTWLTRIVLNAAIDLHRQNVRRRNALEAQDVAIFEDQRALHNAHLSSGVSPERQLARAEMSKLLKMAIADLPEEFRLVFVLREIEGLSVHETANIADLPEATVKTRLFRARRLLREVLLPEFGDLFSDTVTFAGANCLAMTERVLMILELNQKGNSDHDF